MSDGTLNSDSLAERCLNSQKNRCRGSNALKLGLLRHGMCAKVFMSAFGERLFIRKTRAACWALPFQRPTRTWQAAEGREGALPTQDWLAGVRPLLSGTSPYRPLIDTQHLRLTGVMKRDSTLNDLNLYIYIYIFILPKNVIDVMLRGQGQIVGRGKLGTGKERKVGKEKQLPLTFLRPLVFCYPFRLSLAPLSAPGSPGS